MRRISAKQRLQLANLAEIELQRYADNNGLWFTHVCGIELDALQLLRMELLDQHRESVQWDCRRMRKSTTTFLHGLKALALGDHGELCAITPRQAQADKNLREYMLDQIEGSEILSSYLDYRNGRRQLTDTGFTLANKSKAWTAGILGEVDGSGLTYAIMDEIEDMDYERLVDRFLPMLGQTEKLGQKERTKPQARALGVIKGSGIRKEFLAQGFFPMTQPGYPNGPIIGDVYLGMEMGILDADWMAKQRQLMSPRSWKMQMECLEAETSNTVALAWIRRAQSLGLRLLETTDMGKLVEPVPGAEYQRHGLISFGYDHLGHGERPESSRSCLVVAEMLQDHIYFPFVKFWPAWADETRIRADLISFWRYFRPDMAIGDALGVGMLTTVNDDLYSQHLTHINRMEIGGGASTASTWPDWAFSPMRFDGMTKHQMAQALAQVFKNYRAVLPWTGDVDVEALIGVEKDYQDFIDQLGNVKEEASKNGGAYPRYVIDDKQIGDDGFDAAMAAVWGLATRYVAPPTEISTIERARELTHGSSRLILPGVRH